MSSKIIGRKKEINELKKLYNKTKSIFLAIHGRRRVGKTFLINQFFNNVYAFKHTGVSPTNYKDKTAEEILQIELEFFTDSLKKYGAKIDSRISSWREAFIKLEEVINNNASQRKVIFIDEMPWLDTKRSNFLTAFEHFWNDYASARNDVFLIACGSSSGWINRNLINNTGGLYNRVNYQIKLKPFNLREIEEAIKDNDINWTRYQYVQAYMILGGIPQYLSYLDNELSLEENIDNLFYVREAKLKREFDLLFESTFDNAEEIKKIITFLSEKKEGYSREDIAKKLNLTSGGNITKMLEALIDSDFIIKYKSYNTKERKWKYKLVDCFCLFYLKFVKNHSSLDEHFWTNNFTTASINTFRGNAFEIVCFNHVEQIKNKLGISGLITNNALWSYRGNEESKGAQIDLVISRKDNIINLCEAKYTSNGYLMNEEDYEKLINREHQFATTIDKKTIISHVLITTFAPKSSPYLSSYKSVILLDDLFD